MSGENVEEAFLKCSRTIMTKIDGGKSLWHLLVVSNFCSNYLFIHINYDIVDIIFIQLLKSVTEKNIKTLWLASFTLF